MPSARGLTWPPHHAERGGFSATAQSPASKKKNRRAWPNQPCIQGEEKRAASSPSMTELKVSHSRRATSSGRMRGARHVS